MRRYTVSWSVDVTADTARAAAEQAREIMLDPDGGATAFLVELATESRAELVDLGALEVRE